MPAHRKGYGNVAISKRSEYRIWLEMKRRCVDRKNKSYARYGGRGISVCKQWMESFDSFVRDVGPRPSDHHTIERMDNAGDYTPGNVRWATTAEQARNQRSNRRYSFQGESHILTDWASIRGIHPDTLRSRMDKGWSIERALITPTRLYSR